MSGGPGRAVWEAGVEFGGKGSVDGVAGEGELFEGVGGVGEGVDDCGGGGAFALAVGGGGGAVHFLSFLGRLLRVRV